MPDAGEPGASSAPRAAAAGAEPSARKSDDHTGRTLGEFKLLRKLGRGGMAEVYLAEQTSLRRNVAVKILRSEFTSDETYLKRFRQEATAAGTLSHPNIVQVYLIGEQEGTHFIAQEYVQGRNLKEFLARKGPLDLSIALVILRQVAAALQVAGAAGIVHRDIKPENILLTKKGEAKVADFGLAQLTQHGEKVALTQVGITMGTPLYMSPEQVNGKPLDARSDLYSFGVMAYHMLAGKPPFQGETPLAVAVQHLNSQCAPLKSLRPDLPDAMCNFVHKLMAKKRDERYPDAQAVVQELTQLSRLSAGKGDETEPVLEKAAAAVKRPNKSTGRELIWDRPWRRQLAWLIPLCLLAAGSAAGAGWLLRVTDPFETPAKPSGVPRMGTPQGQWYHALSDPGNPAVWMAILENFPPEPAAQMYRDRAALQLAMIDLRDNHPQEAEEKFARMLFEGETEGNRWKKAHALAGQAIIASLLGRVEESRQKLADVRNMGQKTLDAVMDDALQDAIRRNGGR
jgi:tRNA A-37 threonylcarbamoyl transferase component Bud32